MPEKPEVITVVNSLKRYLLGKTIQSVDVFWNAIISYPNVPTFQEEMKQEQIHDITCRGKWIVISLTNYLLLIHLRMEGKFFFRKTGTPRSKHEHILFHLTDGEDFRFCDTRKFGRIVLVSKADAYSREPLCSLGLEYYDANLTPDYLLEHFKTKRIPIKTTLLDQTIIAGIGNIYDDEILFATKINPYQPTYQITKKEATAIIDATRSVLDHAVSLGGTTIKSFTSEEGVHGLFQNELQIHGMKTCPVCNTTVRKVMIGGRGTYYCPKCQILKRRKKK